MSGSDFHNTGRNQPENTEMLSIDDLPEEVLLEVFSYLLLSDRKHVRLVNKQWNELCNSARFTKHETFLLHDISHLDNTNISRTIINLKFHRAVFSNAKLLLPFWRKHGCRVKSLYISGSYFEDPVLNDVMNYCPNIEHISLYFFRHRNTNITILGIKLENLVELELKFCVPAGCTVGMLTRNAPKLKHFALSIDKEEVENRNILNDTMTLIENQSHTLETLSLKNCSFVNDSFINIVIEQVGVQLTGFLIPECKYVSDNLLFTIAKKFANLEMLDASGNYELGRNMDPTLFSNLKKLKLLNLGSTSITDQDLSAVAALEQIEGLDLNFCETLTADGISKAFGTKLHDKLLDIRLGYNQCVTDQVLSQILPQLPNLRSIDLTSCREITALGVSAITTNCKLLRLLSLEGCSKISSLSAPDMNGLKGLLYLNLYGCVDVGAVDKLKYLELQVISLFYVPLTVECLKSLLVNCPSLQFVVLNWDSVENVDLATIKETLVGETGRKLPAFRTGPKFPRTIFELSVRHFNGFPCR